jgi:hypothetical protein
MPFEDAAPFQPVYLAVSAPRRAAPGAAFTARFSAYVEALAPMMNQLLHDLDRDDPGGRQVVPDLSPDRSSRWAIGTPVMVRVFGKNLHVQPSTRSFEWSGKSHLLSFVVTPAPSASVARTQLCFEASIEGVSMLFVPLNVDLTPERDQGDTDTRIARPMSSAFASYASQDAPLVALCLSALKRWDRQLDIFMDCLDLTPNEEWKAQLARIIPTKDAFLLFWSVNARKSSCVAWELETATAAKGIDCVRPMPLDDPGVAPPPPSLEHLHFRDRYLLARQGFLRLAAERLT